MKHAKVITVVLAAFMLLLVAARPTRALPAADSEDPGDILPDPAGDADEVSTNNDVGTGDSGQPEPAKKPSVNLADLKDIWSDPAIPEIRFDRAKPKYSPEAQLRNTMTAGGFRRPKVRFGDYYIEG